MVVLYTMHGRRCTVQTSHTQRASCDCCVSRLTAARFWVSGPRSSRSLLSSNTVLFAFQGSRTTRSIAHGCKVISLEEACRCSGESSVLLLATLLRTIASITWRVGTDKDCSSPDRRVQISSSSTTSTIVQSSPTCFYCIVACGWMICRWRRV